MKFYKYQGAGNDFVILEAIDESIELNDVKVRFLCHRRFGIGADGLIVIKQSNDADFHMEYFNSDGTTGMLCGNGARCAVLYVASRGYVEDNLTFTASDGIHKASIINENTISISFNNVTSVEKYGNNYYTNTGTHHLVCPVEKNDLTEIDVVSEGRKLRNKKEFEPEGVNVNFIQKIEDFEYNIRTYEKGVEDETLACGTGIAASAICSHYRLELGEGNFDFIIHTPTETMTVSFHYHEGQYRDLWLTGPAVKVYKGEIEINMLHFPSANSYV